MKYFIKASPVGELNLVLADVMNIVDKELFEHADIKQAVREYFESHRQQIKLPDGQNALVNEMWRQNPIEATDDAKAEEFVYFDQKLNVKFSFDPNTLQATVQGTESDFPEQLDAEWATYKAAVNEEVESYVDKAYKSGTTRASLCFNQAGNLQIDISCINLNLKHFWGGEWQSQWIVDIQASTMHGSIRVNNHYFENGNVQFNLVKKFEPVPLKSSDGAGICQTINELESKYQLSVEDVLENMKEGMFKRMRRFVPVTGQKFDWDKPKMML